MSFSFPAAPSGVALRPRRADQGNDFAPVSAIDAEIFLVHRDDAAFWIKLAHPDEAEIGQVGFTIAVAFGQSGQMRKVIVAIEGERNQVFGDHLKHEAGIAQMEGGFR